MRRRKGVITVEAALVVPIVTMAIYALISLMNIVWVYDSVQTSLNNTANIIGSNSYVMSESGIISITENSGVADQESLGANVISVINGIFTGETTTEDIDNIVARFKNPNEYQQILRNLRDSSDNYYVDYLISIGNIFLSLGLNGQIEQSDLEAILGTTTKIILEESLKNDLGGGYVKEEEVQKRMKSIGIVDGFDVSKTTFKIEDGDNSGEINAIVSYKIDIGNPIFRIEPFEVTQRVAVRPWIGK